MEYDVLLIGQPKSATTSLAATIGNMGRLNVRYGISRNQNSKKCKGFSEIQKYHNNMIQRSPEFLAQVTKGKKTIFKEHLLPTVEHRRILEKLKQPVVILIRNPEDSLDSYKRLFKEKGKKANLDKLYEDLKKFHDTWMHWASNKPYAIVVEYRDLVLYFKNEIKRIFRCFKMKLPLDNRKYFLARKKYTGIGEKRVIDRTT
jgi:hypothetical protein